LNKVIANKINEMILRGGRVFEVGRKEAKPSTDN
jgi:hypothetical protein